MTKIRDTISDILALVSRCEETTGLSAKQIGALSVQNPGLIYKMRKGYLPAARTLETLELWLAERLKKKEEETSDVLE